MTFDDYKKLTKQERELHTFELLNRIYEQVQKTNGRVTALEVWRWITTGGVIIIASVVLPIFLGLVK